MRTSLFKRRDPSADGPDARKAVDLLIDHAAQLRASDIHIEPMADGFEVRLRVDGLLQTTEQMSTEIGRGLVTRLMVMAQLLTYRLDVPQEGRLIALAPSIGKEVEARLAVMPTTHGLRAVLRMPAEIIQPQTLDELDLPGPVVTGLKDFADREDGLLLLTGPAGSGKTTTIYALLQYIRSRSEGLSIIALEDPVERDLPGVTQIEVRPFGELTYETALRSILRQDPQVLMLGEIRDRATATLAIQAALTGHRLISTFHAGTPGGAIARLLEMEIEPYQIAGSLYGIVAQRLMRRRVEQGEYRGRVPAGEFARVDDALRRLIHARADAACIAGELADRAGHETVRDSAERLVTGGLTDSAELRRVLGKE